MSKIKKHYFKLTIAIIIGIIGVCTFFNDDAVAAPGNTIGEEPIAKTVELILNSIDETPKTTSVVCVTTERTTTTSVSTTTVKKTEVTTTKPTTKKAKKKSNKKKKEEPKKKALDYDYLFYSPSMRVHTPNCVYADPSCMEEIKGDYIYNARKCVECNPDINIEIEYVPEPEPEEEQGSWGGTYIDQMTYYSGPWGCYGAAGVTLIDNYSCACNSVPLGTILYIQSSDGSVDGYYRVDDRGGMSGNVVDIFYSDYSNTPSSFRQLGRVSCTAYIVE